MTRLCVPIFVEDPEQALADAREARDRGADIVEFRVDPYFHGSADADGAERTERLVALVAASPLPCIVTCRPVLEGGHYDGPDDARMALYERLGAMAGADGHAPAYIDVELATYKRSANLKQKVNLAVDHPAQLRPLTTQLILSAHDFQTRPPNLVRQVLEMQHEPACRVLKVAYRARSLRDNLELFDLLTEVQNAQDAGVPTDAGEASPGTKPVIALAMGPFGLLSRVLAPKFDAFLTFAALRRDKATAPGQPILSELLETYRFRSITRTTRVYGVVGWPVEHSISPLVHNAGFEAVGHDGVYLPLPVPPEYEHFKATVLALIDHPFLDLGGLSVTIPHKEHLVRLAREETALGDQRWSLDLLSERGGAANTLAIRRDARGQATRLDVRNTDAPAAIAALRAVRPDLQRVAILGAGGTARALAAAFRLRHTEVFIVNRTREKAETLVRELLTAESAGDGPGAAPPMPAQGLRVVEARELSSLHPDAVINCTPLGMQGGPGPSESALSLDVLCNLSDGTVVADCVYRPLATPLMSQAASRRLPCIDGLAMFLGQAAEQFSLWTDRSAPMQLFQTVASESLT